MAWQMIDDLNGDVVAADQARALAITLDGDPLAAYDVTARPVDELLADLGRLLVDGIAARIGPDEPLDPGPLHEPNDEPAVDESAEEQPVWGQPIESPQVTTVPTPPGRGESAENGILRDVAEPLDKGTVDVGAVTTGESLPAGSVGEAVRGQASDATVRAWARTHHVPCSTTGALKAWVRAEYERLAGAPPDFRTRRMAREVGAAELTSPSVDPGVATHDTVNVWLARNGLEDRLPPTDAGRAAYREAWQAAHPAPPAAPPAAAGQDTAGPDTSAADWSSARRDPAVANAHPLPDDPAPAPAPAASVRPAVEPIGDGTAEPDSRPEQLEKADELASEGKTPRQIMAATGVWLREARAAVRKAAQR